MQSVLENIISLHRVDGSIKQIQKQCQEIPIAIEELQNQLKILQTKLEAIKNQIKENEKQIRKNEQQIEDNRQQQGKYRTQLFKLKSNREYNALIEEVKTLEGSNSKLETDILELMLTIDSKREEVKRVDINIKDRDKEIKVKIAEMEKTLIDEQANLKNVEKTRHAIIEALSEEVIDRYNKICRKQGSSVAEIIAGSCSGCNVKLRPQLSALARSNADLINCERCGRYLYWGLESE